MRLVFNPLTGNFDYVGNESSSSSLLGVFGQDEGIPLGTGTILNFVGANVEASISGTVIRVFVTGSSGGDVNFPIELIGVYGKNQGQNVGTGTIFNVTEPDLNLSLSGTTLNLARATGTTYYLGVNGSRLYTYTASGSWLILTNTQDPQELIGVYGRNQAGALGTGTTFYVSGSRLNFSYANDTLSLTNSPDPIELIGMYGKDEGQNIGTGTILNVVGDNVSLSLSGTTLTLLHTNPSVSFPQEVIGVMGQDEGVPLGTGATLNVVGNNINLSVSGSVLLLSHTDPTFPQELIGIYGTDEGSPLGTGTRLDVVGENLSMSLSGTTLTLNHTNPTISFPQEVIGIYGQDEGVPLGTGTILNVVGDNINLSISGSVLLLQHTNPSIAFPQPVLGVMGWDDGVPKGTGTVIDFGNNLTASLSGTVLRVDASSSASLNGQDEGVPLGTFSTVNAVGSRIVASLSGTVLQLATSPDPIDNIGVAIQNEGNFLATGATLDVMGAVTLSGSVVSLRVPKTVTLIASATAGGVVFTNLLAADTTYSAYKVDLVGYTQCKLSGIFGATANATASGTIIHLMYATGVTFATLGELASSPTSENARLRWITSQQRTTPWFDINPVAAIDGVGLHVRITGGNGTADPNLLGLFAEFR